MYRRTVDRVLDDLAQHRRKITVRRGRNIAAVAVAVRMLALGYYSYAMAHIRALTSTGSTAAPVGGKAGSSAAVGRVVSGGAGGRRGV
jgi:hypothetical protein